MMKQSGNKLRLKIKKKNTNPKSESDKTATPLSSTNTSVSRKRSNPFSLESDKKVFHGSDGNIAGNKSILIGKLNSIQQDDSPAKIKNIPITSNGYTPITSNGYKPNENDDPVQDEDEKRKLKYSSPLLPLDWGIKQKLQIISKEPLKFCSNVKSIDKAIGLMNFASNMNDSSSFYQHLCCWIYPFIPGVRNFPLRKTASDKVVPGTKDKAVSINSDHLFREGILQQWKISFQSLFNMLKARLCPYFYLCSHQFSVFFKYNNTNDNNITVILTPTTKGLRGMLVEEDISFSFMKKGDVESSLNTTSDATDDDRNNTSGDDDSEYDADSFLNSLGLDKGTHFPNIEEQRKLSVKSELNRLDNRPESTIVINDGQGFFNFLLNSQIICPTSGRMAGIPPTLLSPVVFQGASCYTNKYSNGKMKQRTDVSETVLHYLDVYGYVLPTNLKGLVDLLLKESDEFTIRTKGYKNLFAFNMNGAGGDSDDCEEKEFIHQSSRSIPDQCDLQYKDKLFTF